MEMASALLPMDRVKVNELSHDSQASKETLRTRTSEFILLLLLRWRNEEYIGVLQQLWDAFLLHENSQIAKK